MQIGMQHFLKIKWSKIKPWLVFGKGPSFERYKNFDLSKYNTLCMNATSTIIDCDVAHFIDYETYLRCFNKCKGKKIIMPLHPHIKFKPRQEPIHFPSDRFIYYDLNTWPSLTTFPPVIKARYFSSEAVFNILGLIGVKNIFSLGIDGGKRYAKNFNDEKPLRNGQKTYSIQEKQLLNICKKNNIIWKKL